MSNRAKRSAITIQHPIRTKDSERQPTYRWENLYQNIRASYEQIIGDEKNTALRKVEAIAEGVFTINFNRGLKITTDHRVWHNGKTFGIVRVDSVGRKTGEGGDKETHIYVKEVADA